MARINHQSLIDIPNMKKQKTYPTFLVIGGQKCGTTWLAKMARRLQRIYPSSGEQR